MPKVNNDSEFLEIYTPEDEGREWRRVPKYDGIKRQRKSTEHYQPEARAGATSARAPPRAPGPPPGGRPKRCLGVSAVGGGAGCRSTAQGARAAIVADYRSQLCVQVVFGARVYQCL